jgi:hypothetical protein
VTVSFNVKYSYNSTIQKEKLGAGENILDFTADKGTEFDRSHINAEALTTGKNTCYGTGSTGIIKSDSTNRAIFMKHSILWDLLIIIGKVIIILDIVL